MTTSVDCVVIGAGVVGLAVARKLAMSGHETIILEMEDIIGAGTSSRNSEVVHAGIYYPKGSLKAVTCVEGRNQLYDFCESHGIGYRKCGKLIIATTPEELNQLHSIRQAAIDNGVDDIQYLDRQVALNLEPKLNCIGALLSPSTGIVDSHGFMLALQGDAEAAGAIIAFKSRVVEIKCNGVEPTISVDLEGEARPYELNCRYLVNAAGLDSIALAQTIPELDKNLIPEFYMTKGNYFSLSGKSPFSRLIYPIPPKGGLGTHLTLDLSGQAKFGPDIEPVDRLDYNVDPDRSKSFCAAIRTYWPDLPDNALLPDYSGIRPKIRMPNNLPQDFIISDQSNHRLPGLINLFGIESPGLTASLALANRVQQIIDGSNTLN